MKQFFALAALFAVLSVSAQEKTDIKGQDHRGHKGHEMKMDKKDESRKDGENYKGEKKQKLTIDEKVAQFDQYGVSSSQKNKIKSLLESCENEKKKEFTKEGKQERKSKEEIQKKRNEFNLKMEKILNKKQYAQYQENQQKRKQEEGHDQMKGEFEHKGAQKVMK